MQSDRHYVHRADALEAQRVALLVRVPVNVLTVTMLWFRKAEPIRNLFGGSPALSMLSALRAHLSCLRRCWEAGYCHGP